ncbi:MAG: hypothetical protein RML94_00070 [Bacteroidia bacterium]|nr:hypothetical protein [Bacteroidia bacterium]
MRTLSEVLIVFFTVTVFVIAVSVFFEQCQVDTLPQVQVKNTLDSLERDNSIAVTFQYLYFYKGEYYYEIAYQNRTSKPKVKNIKGIIMFHNRADVWEASKEIDCCSCWSKETYAYPGSYGFIKDILIVTYEEF